ncbi:hypothetical protein KY385_00120 [Candidatus Parcubacteria bacterium]|nr:hypothetical protein [Candidatus Parcubacteria bacterium]
MAVAAIAETLYAPPESVNSPELKLIYGTGQLELIENEGNQETTPYQDVIKVSEIPGDAELVAQAQRNIKTRLVGDLAVSEAVEVKDKPIKNTREGIIWASRCDAEGIAMTDANIGTEMVEQAYKAGNVVTIKLQVDANDIYQNGQRMSDVHRNANHLASADPIIKPRTVAEANNTHRMKRLYDMGLLEDNVYVRFSMCAEGVSDEKLDELRFFSSTKSISVQMAYSENGQLLEEIAMVAGVPDKDAPRHDRKMVEGVARHFNQSYEDKSAPEIIGDGMIIPKIYAKNGVVDFVRIMDDINGGTFYGQKLPRQDYLEHKIFCEQRAARFKDDVVDIRNQLIREIDSLPTAVDASKRLAKLVEGRMVDKALNDTSIDPSVFGAESAASLVRARELKAFGNHHEAQAFMQHARATAKGGSCPAAFLLEKGLSNNVSKEDAWAGGEQKGGTCVNCSKKTTVGVKNWCKGCIKGNCG